VSDPVGRVRTREQRLSDTRARLERDVDLWVATAAADGGRPYLVPLSFLWDGSTVLVSTPTASPTARNLRDTGRVRLGVGLSRDVVLVEGTAQAIADHELSTELADAFAAKTGFDPRELTTPYTYFRITPTRVQAWREADELAGRELMRDGMWAVS